LGAGGNVNDSTQEPPHGKRATGVSTGQPARDGVR
jgi:hypothetical protein